MRALIQTIRARLFSTEDTVCLERARLVTAAFREHADDPMCLRRAKAFAHVLRNMTVEVDPNPLFAGNTSSRLRGWMLVPEHGFSFDNQVMIENDALEHIRDYEMPADLAVFWEGRSVGGACDPGHLAVDYALVVHTGLAALIERIRALPPVDKEGETYRQAMVIALEGVVGWAGRYADAAESAARRATDPVVRDAHLRVAAACRHVPAKPARNLFEGLQAIALIHLALAIEGHGMSISIGLPDRVLARFVDESFDAEFATELVAAFMLKVAANSIFGRGSKTQAITVGGLDHRGNDRCNRLTLCFLEACDLARTGDPHLFLRWHEGIDERVKRRATELLASGLSMPLLVHDEPTVAGFVGAGVEPIDAWNYCVIGCNELGIPGLSADSSSSRAGSIQYLEVLNDVLLHHPDPDAIDSTDALLRLVEEDLEGRLRRGRQHYVVSEPKAVREAPVPYASALMHGCVESGQDMRGAMKYRMPGLYERGLTNAANGLAAIEQLVFKERTVSMSGLVRAMRDGFAEPVVREHIRQTAKWGNGDERADRWAVALVEARERILARIDVDFAHPSHFVCHVVRSLHHVDGQRIATSPDGRLAGLPVADSIGADVGTARNGPTGVLNSVVKLDAAQCYRGGYNLNLTLTKSNTTAESIQALAEGFFCRGGQELQINCFDTETLRNAQKRPHEYGDLIVRFAGLSARFVDLSRAEQDELIARTRPPSRT